MDYVFWRQEVDVLTRNLMIMGLLGFLALPTLTLAQQTYSPSQSDKGGASNVVSLTTTDLLSAQDFAAKVIEAPAAKRKINPKRLTKADTTSPTVAATTEDKVVNRVKQELGKILDVDANTMHPTGQVIAATETNLLPAPMPVSVANPQLEVLITTAAQRNGIDEKLIWAVMRQESSFNSRAISYKGARGLMQLMPATAARFGVRDIFDPAQNIEGGARYLRFLLDTFNGDVELALAGYNAGEGAVFRYGNRIPPYRETQDYVRKISANYVRMSNGNYVRRPTNSLAMEETKKIFASEPLTVGRTMTQY